MAKNLVGQVFGRLKVISRAPSILGGQKTKRWWGAWNCLCECGNTKIVITQHLVKGQVSSCGCLIGQHGVTLKPGMKFDRLTTIEYKNAKWKCLCDCGNITIWINTNSLTSGNTKSCGCYNTEQLSERAYLLHDAIRQFDKPTASARKLWQTYLYRDQDKNHICMDFDDFYSMTQENCFYCGVEPKQEFSSTGNSDAIFVYNGIDRVDSLIGHIKENCVACCRKCNVAKNDRPIQDFKVYVSELVFNEFPKNYSDALQNIDETIIPIIKYWNPQVKIVFNTGYKDGDMNMGQFYYMSQLPCFYCSNMRSNNFSRYKGENSRMCKEAQEVGQFLYNGLDRIDSSRGHTIDNCVPCCYYCNFAKGKRDFNEFQEWIARIKSYAFWTKQEYIDLVGKQKPQTK